MKNLKNLEESINYLYSLIDYEKNRNKKYNTQNYNINRTKNLIKLLGEPDKNLKIIHIAGSKGKGSIANILSYLLTKLKKKNGLFTSPHLISLNERIKINNININNNDLIKYSNLIKEKIEKMNDIPTFFEALTALAIKYFSDNICEYVILETGLGGRLDSTNFCNPILTIITAICLDHEKILGSDIISIVNEKLGILKKSVPVLIFEQPKKLKEYIINTVSSKNLSYYSYGNDFSVSNIETSLKGTNFSIKMGNEYKSNISIPLIGSYQAKNFVTSLYALTILKVPYNIEYIIQNVSDMNLAGRFEIISKKPLLIIDGAHNPYSIKKLCQNINMIFPKQKIRFIIYILPDKNYRLILDIISKVAREIIICRIDTFKTDNSQELYSISKNKVKSIIFDNSTRTIEYIYKSADENDIFIATGSFYLIGEIKKIISEKIEDTIN